MIETIEASDPAPTAIDYLYAGKPTYSIYRGVWSGRPRVAYRSLDRRQRPGRPDTWAIAPRASTMEQAHSIAQRENDTKQRVGFTPIEKRSPVPVDELFDLGIELIESHFEHLSYGFLLSETGGSVRNEFAAPGADPWLAVDHLLVHRTLGVRDFLAAHREILAGAPVDWVLAFVRGDSE